MYLRLFILIPLLMPACMHRSGLQLREVSQFNTPGWAHDVALDQTRVYVADRQGGFLTFNVNSGLTTPRIASPVRDVISLCPNSGMPVLASRFEGCVLVSAFGKIHDRYSNGDIANAVQVRGDTAFAAYGLTGLMALHLTGERVERISALPTQGWSHDLRLSGNLAYVADWNGLKVIDIRDPARLSTVAFLPSPGTCISLALQEYPNRRMLALAEGHGGVGIAELDPEGRPSLIGRHSLGLNPFGPIHPKSGGWVHSVAWAGHYIFAANWKRGLAVLDILDPKHPRVVLQLPTSGTSLGVKTQRQPDGTYLVYLADGESGLRIFHFSGSDPDKPFI